MDEYNWSVGYFQDLARAREKVTQIVRVSGDVVSPQKKAEETKTGRLSGSAQNRSPGSLDVHKTVERRIFSRYRVGE